MELTVSDIIQIIGIIVALVTSIASIIISVVALKQNSDIIKESNKAQIEIFPVKIYGDIVPRIRIQNFGQSTGKIKSVVTIPEIPNNNVLINPFEYYDGLTLAPNQSFTTLFAKNDMAEPPISKFSVIITYETLGETVTSTHNINYSFLDGIMETSSPSKSVEKALDKINQSIQGLQ